MIASRSSSKKAKGTRLEKLIAQRINEVLGCYGIKAQRMPLSGAVDGFKSDIHVNLPISIEAKNQEKWTVPEWWDQTVGQAGLGKMPILVISRNFCNNPLAIISLEDLLFFMELAIMQGWVSYIKKGRRVIK